MRDQASKSAAISELTKQIRERENDVRRYQEGINLIPALQAEIRMLEGSLAIIQGGTPIKHGESQAGLPLNGTPIQPKTIGVVAYEILKQAGKPLHVNEILSLSEARGTRIIYKSLTKMISERVRQGKQFYREGAGTYGLKEWKVNQ